MEQYARLDNNVVVEILTPVDGFLFEQCFPPHVVAACVPCTADAEPGWVYDGNTLSPPAPPPPPSYETAYEAKYAEIISRSNTVKNFLSSRFSFLEENTWPEQEAGARAILNDADNVKDKVARLILASQTGTANAVALVNQLAITDGVAPEAFAARIVANADLSYQAGIATLMEQRAMESQLNAAQTVEEVLSLNVFYSLLAME